MALTTRALKLITSLRDVQRQRFNLDLALFVAFPLSTGTAVLISRHIFFKPVVMNVRLAKVSLHLFSACGHLIQGQHHGRPLSLHRRDRGPQARAASRAIERCSP